MGRRRTQATKALGRIVTRRHGLRTGADLLATTDESRAVSEALHGYGSSFEGPTICSVFMQSAGLVPTSGTASATAEGGPSTCRGGPPSAAAYGAPAVAPAALTPSLFTIRGAVAGTPPVNSSRKDRFTKSGAPMMLGGVAAFVERVDGP